MATTSPFLLLPGELRNQIYTHALHHNRPAGMIAATPLFRVCHQVYDEAKNILHADSVFFIKVTRNRKIEGDIAMSTEGSLSLRTFSTVWPAAMRRFPNIEMVLENALTAPPEVLYGFSAFLNTADCIVKHITLRQNIPGIDFPKRKQQALTYPLLKLSPRIALRFSGLSPINQARFERSLLQIRSESHLPEALHYNILDEHAKHRHAITRAISEVRRKAPHNTSQTLELIWRRLRISIEWPKCGSASHRSVTLAMDHLLMVDMEMLKDVVRECDAGSDYLHFRLLRVQSKWQGVRTNVPRLFRAA